MRIVLVAIQMLVLALPALAEEPFARYVPAVTLKNLRAGEILSATIPADGHLDYLPAVSSRDFISGKIAAAPITVGVEVLGMLSGPEMSSPDGWLALYNTLHAVSTMQGMTYYSVSHGAREVLFKYSFAIDGVRQAARIPDPVFTAIPAENKLMTLQEDTSFGRTLYEESYLYRGDHMVATIENLTNVNILFIPIIQPRNLVSQFTLVPVGKEVLFYGVCYLRSGMPLGDHTSREASLRNRLFAMADWLKARLDEGLARK
jgi:hypothetical protein